MDTIFISIAAYQDPKLVDTIRSAIDNADIPNRVHFGIALQYDVEPNLKEFKNIKSISYNPETRPGIVRIRYEISTMLFDKQDFYLQIDSHYLFSPGWDTQLVEYYKKISQDHKTDKIIVFPLEKYDNEIMTSRFKLKLDPGAIYQIAHPVPINDRMPCTTDYHEIYFARVGQIFLPRIFIEDVGLDPYSQTIAEIAYFSYRVIMSGYRVFQVNKRILWQDDSDYMNAVWKTGDHSVAMSRPDRFRSMAVEDSKTSWYEMSLALIYNNFSKYAVKNATMSAEQFWLLQDDHEGFVLAKKYFDKVIHSNLI